MTNEPKYPIELTPTQIMKLILLIEDDADRKYGIGHNKDNDLKSLRANLIYLMLQHPNTKLLDKP